MPVRAAEVRAGRWELTGAGDLDVFNDYLGDVADRGYSPRTVRAYAFDLLHFARSMNSFTNIGCMMSSPGVGGGARCVPCPLASRGLRTTVDTFRKHCQQVAAMRYATSGA